MEFAFMQRQLGQRQLGQRQRGMTGIGWLIVLALVALFATVALRLVPVYLEYYKVVTALESVVREPNLQQMSREEILTRLFNRFDIDDVDNVRRQDIRIERGPGQVTVRAAYERRVQLLGNVDAVVHFDKRVVR